MQEHTTLTDHADTTNCCCIYYDTQQVPLLLH